MPTQEEGHGSVIARHLSLAVIDRRTISYSLRWVMIFFTLAIERICAIFYSIGMILISVAIFE